jgi:hypothetical protein
MSEGDISHTYPNFISGGKVTRCPKGHFLPDNVVTCPVCAAEQGEKALQDLQTEFLRKAQHGDWNYTLRVSKTAERHALLYPNHKRTFCGQELKKPKIEYAPYTTDTLAKLCPACRAAIAGALQIMDDQL